MRAEDAQIPPNTDKSHAVPIASGNTSQKAAVVLFSGPI
jgi:rhodanese-related sulfurtransferase